MGEQLRPHQAGGKENAAFVEQCIIRLCFSAIAALADNNKSAAAFRSLDVTEMKEVFTKGKKEGMDKCRTNMYNGINQRIAIAIF